MILTTLEGTIMDNNRDNLTKNLGKTKEEEGA